MDGMPRYAHPDQLEQLLPRGRVYCVIDLGYLVLVPLPCSRSCGLADPVTTLDDAECREGLNDRQPEVADADKRGEAARPAVGVDDIRWLGGPGIGQVTAKVTHMRQQVIRAHVLRRSSWYMPDREAGRDAYHVRLVGRVPTRVHGHLVARLGQRTGQTTEIHVLTASVSATDRSQRVRLLGDYGDLHLVSSSNARSHHTEPSQQVRRPSSASDSPAGTAQRLAAAANSAWSGTWRTSAARPVQYVDRGRRRALDVGPRGSSDQSWSRNSAAGWVDAA